MENESTLELQIIEYETQLSQVELALGLSEGSAKEDLTNLCSDLKQLIELTKESLLSLKKKRLLREIELLERNETSDSGTCSISDARGEDAASSGGTVNIEVEKRDTDLQELLESLQGTRCQAPFGHSWGQVGYYNALVLSTESSEDLTSIDDVKVRVLFCNPTSEAMKPCPYFMDGNCRFSQEECRFSHGHVISLQSLRQFIDPDYSLLQRDAPCLAKFTDGIWYPAIVETVDDDHHKVTIQYKQYGNIATVDLEDIVPNECESGSESGESENDVLATNETESGDDSPPTTAWVSTAPTSQALGEWEKHTKGIGSKLMAQMGYVLGQGLGKNGKGRLEPIEAVVLPQGKSLDKVMELKEKAGNRNLIKVEKKLRRQQRKKEKAIVAGYHYETKASVFDFINKKLEMPERNAASSSLDQHEGALPISKSLKGSSTKQMLKAASVKILNTQSFQVAEDIRKNEQELDRLQIALTRNETKDKKVALHLREKINQQENNLRQLKAFEKAIHGEQHLRKNDKKLAIF